MTNEEKNKKICGILGIHWHELDKKLQRCKCGVKGPSANPDFYTDAGAVRLLRELEKWERGKLFFAHQMYVTEGYNIEAVDDDGYINREFITTPGLLADKLIEWKEEKG